MQKSSLSISNKLGSALTINRGGLISLLFKTTYYNVQTHSLSTGYCCTAVREEGGGVVEKVSDWEVETEGVEEYSGV